MFWIAPDGCCFVTIPKDRRDPAELEADPRVSGAILRVSPEGDAVIVSDGLDLKSPNGVTGSADGRNLYYTNRGKVWRARVTDKGGLAAPMVVAPKAWDGLALDAGGHIFTTGEDGVEIYDSAGNKAGTIAVPEAVANFCLGGPEGRTLFITARTSLYRFDMPRRVSDKP